MIVYLEPSRHTPLWGLLEAFRQESRKECGPTDAHAYHPHCSLTGFWELYLPESAEAADSNTADDIYGANVVEDTIRNVALQCGETVDRTTKSVTINHDTPPRFYFPPPTIRPPLIPPHNPKCLIMPLDCPTHYVEFARTICVSFESSGKFVNRMRAKKCDHISLAYFSPTEEISDEDKKERIRRMKTVADDVFAEFFKESIREGRAAEGWDIVYYEIVKEERYPLDGGEHQFEEVGRWRVA